MEKDIDIVEFCYNIENEAHFNSRIRKHFSNKEIIMAWYLSDMNNEYMRETNNIFSIILTNKENTKAVIYKEHATFYEFKELCKKLEFMQKLKSN